MNFSDELIDLTFTRTRPHPIGRPPKLTAEMIEEICDYIISGYSIAGAGRKAKVSESTIYRWLAMARSGSAEQIYLDLAERVKEATECSEFELLQAMRMAAAKDKNWRALAWLLERRYPEKYGKRIEATSQRLGKEPGAESATVLTIA